MVIRKSTYTTVTVDDEPGPGNACHKYSVQWDNQGYVGSNGITFQHGPIREVGVNGVQNEDLLAIVVHRLQGFQAGDFSCRENAIALTKIQEAIMWLDKRTADRQSRGVEGKNIV